MENAFGNYFLGKSHFSRMKNVCGMNFAIFSDTSVLSELPVGVSSAVRVWLGLFLLGAHRRGLGRANLHMFVLLFCAGSCEIGRLIDGRNHAIVIAEPLARVLAAIRIASVRWRSYLP